MFKEISIKNYRGINNIDITDISRFNLFLGNNGCGKTTILEAIFQLINPTNPELTVRTSILRNIPIPSWKYYFKDTRYDIPIQLKGALNKNNEIRLLNIFPLLKNEFDNTIIENKSNEEFFQSGNVQTIFGLTMRSKITSDSTPTEESVQKLFESPEGIKKDPVKTTENYLKGIFVISSDPTPDLLIAKRLEQIFINKEEDKILYYLRYLDPNLVRVQLGREDNIFCDIGINSLIPINSLGAGITKFLRIALAIRDNKNGIVLIDEIENGLYPSSIEKIWEMIIAFSQELNIQIFATTHSLECTKMLLKKHKDSLFEADSLRIFRIENNKGEHRVTKFNKETANIALEENWDIR